VENQRMKESLLPLSTTIQPLLENISAFITIQI
jgi:hypothetical protein